MITFILDYYSYGAARHGQSRFSVHNDGSVNMYSARSTSIYDTYTTNLYRSSDGYVVLVQESPGNYFYGWTLHALHNMGYSTFDVGVSAFTTSSSLSGAY
jgi:hypothetical protein